MRSKILKKSFLPQPAPPAEVHVQPSMPEWTQSPSSKDFLGTVGRASNQLSDLSVARKDASEKAKEKLISGIMNRLGSPGLKISEQKVIQWLVARIQTNEYFKGEDGSVFCHATLPSSDYIHLVRTLKELSKTSKKKHADILNEELNRPGAGRDTPDPDYLDENPFANKRLEENLVKNDPKQSKIHKDPKMLPPRDDLRRHIDNTEVEDPDEVNNDRSAVASSNKGNFRARLLRVK